MLKTEIVNWVPPNGKGTQQDRAFGMSGFQLSASPLSWFNLARQGPLEL